MYLIQEDITETFQSVMHLWQNLKFSAVFCLSVDALPVATINKLFFKEQAEESQTFQCNVETCCSKMNMRDHHCVILHITVQYIKLVMFKVSFCADVLASWKNHMLSIF